MAALVPTEVLLDHALILDATTETDVSAGPWTTEITDPETLTISFWARAICAGILFAAARFKKWKTADLIRMFVPPCAFVVWTMLQKTTAFDVIAPAWGLTDGQRVAFGVIGALLLMAVAAVLAMTAERSGPPEEDRRNRAVRRAPVGVEEAW